VVVSAAISARGVVCVRGEAVTVQMPEQMLAEKGATT